MHSSTSSSNARLPREAFGRVWILALLLLLVGTIGMEIVFRAHGYQPSVRDHTPLWALTRVTMPPYDRNVVALVGSSRMQCDISLDVFEDTYGSKPVQLSLIASSPIPMLGDLADDVHFRGLVLCEMSPALFFSNDNEYYYIVNLALAKRDAMDDALFDYWETRALVFLQSHFVSLSGELQMKESLPEMISGRWPDTPYRFRGDRVRFFDSTKTTRSLPDIPLPEASPEGITMTPEEMEIIAKVKGYVGRIRERGGDVVFVYLPCRGDNKVDEILHYPHEIYWETLLRETDCFGINSDYHETLWQYTPQVDYSHLDYKDAEEFTRNFVFILQSRIALEKQKQD